MTSGPRNRIAAGEVALDRDVSVDGEITVEREDGQVRRARVLGEHHGAGPRDAVDLEQRRVDRDVDDRERPARVEVVGIEDDGVRGGRERE